MKEFDTSLGEGHLPYNPVAMYLMASYAYYVEDDPIMNDWTFEEYGRKLYENYDAYKAHPHCPSREDLEAGTYLGPYPRIVISALNHYRRHVLGYK